MPMRPRRSAQAASRDGGTGSFGLSRRGFLGGIARGAAALAASPVAHGLAASPLAAPRAAGSLPKSAGGESAPPPRWPLKLSTSSIHFLRLPIEKACERIAALGFEAVDIWSGFQGCPHLDDAAERLGPDGLRRVLEENRLRLFAFSVYVGGYPKYAKLLGEAGGGVAVQGSGPPAKPEDLTASMRRFLEGLKPEIELAEKHRSRIAIENHGDALLDSLDSLKAFVDLNRSSRLGIALAPYHVQARGESVERAIETAGEQLLFFYAWQKGEGTKQLPGEGPADFAPWVAALERIRYAGFANVFLHADLEPEEMARLLARSRDYLRAAYEKTGARR